MKTEWKRLDRLPIQQRTADMLRLAIDGARQQLKHERKKLKKLKYGI